MDNLSPEECRILGVLIEKELTTPEQYPLSLNAIVNGANQKNNRDPVTSYTDDQAFEAVESLRQKGLVIRVDAAGSRVPKYRHETPQKLGLTRYELVILAELMLRGPQTLGELRGRASRMHHLDTLDIVKEMLAKLMGRPEPLVRELPPSPGSRAERYMQLLCPDAHPIAPAAAQPEAPAQAGPSAQSTSQRLAQLESEVQQLKEIVRRLATALGEADPFPPEAQGKAPVP